MKYEVIKNELHPVIRSRSSSASDIHVSISGPILYPHQQTGLKLGRNRPGHKNPDSYLVFFAQIILETMEHFRYLDFFSTKDKQNKGSDEKMGFFAHTK